MRFRMALAAAVALAAAGCNEPCKGENVDVIQDTVPASCPAMAPNSAVTLSFEVCVRCNDATPSCKMDAQGGAILLDPIAEACESGSSCPLPSCAVNGADRRVLNCTVTTPASGNLSLMVYDVGQSTTIPVNLTVGGANTTCRI